MTTSTDEVSWFQRTAHCGRCGQPSAYCVCTERRPCGCRHLHPMGAGLTEDRLEAFTIAAPVVSDGQGDLFAMEG